MTDQTIRLLQRWHDGDRAALDALIERNLAWMQQHVRQRLGADLRRAGDTQDFVQEAMVHVLEYGPRFVVESEEQFRGLLARIVENALRGQHRHLHQQMRDIARERGEARDTVLSLDPAQREVTRPSQIADRNEQTAWVRLALEFLPPQDREVLLLREMEGLEFAAIGERIGCTHAAARMRFQRALPGLIRKIRALQQGQLQRVLAED